MVEKLSVFVDTSVLFSAVFSSSGGSRVLLELGEADAVQLVVSRSVLQEAECVFKREAPDLLPLFSILLERSGCMVVPCASAAGRNDLEQWIGHRGDAQIVADALAADADYIVTLDKAHLLGNTSLPGNIAGRIVSPGDLLSVFRSHERLQ